MGIDAENTDGGDQQQETPAAVSQVESNHLKALQAERDRRKAAEDRIAAIEAAKEEAEVEAAKQKGQYKDLFEKAEAERVRLAEANATYEAQKAERESKAVEDANAIVAAWAETDRGLDPKGMSPEERLNHVRMLDARLKTQAPVAAGTRTGTGQRTVTQPPPECVAMAKRLGRDPEDFMPTWLATTAGKAWLSEHSA